MRQGNPDTSNKVVNNKMYSLEKGRLNKPDFKLELEYTITYLTTISDNYINLIFIYTDQRD